MKATRAKLTASDETQDIVWSTFFLTYFFRWYFTCSPKGGQMTALHLVQWQMHVCTNGPWCLLPSTGTVHISSLPFMPLSSVTAVQLIHVKMLSVKFIFKIVDCVFSWTSELHSYVGRWNESVAITNLYKLTVTFPLDGQWKTIRQGNIQKSPKT